MECFAVPSGVAGIFTETVNQICAPGAMFAGSQRREVATMTRRVAAGEAGASDGALGDAVARLTLNAQDVRPEWIAALDERGIGPLHLIELLGVVSRMMAIDTFCFALGVEPWPLPDPLCHAAEGDGPHGETEPAAACVGGWLPTVGPAWPPNALSALPGEHRAMHQLHGVLYLKMDQMGDLDAQRGLHRTQMELVAARTSLLNECFF